MSNDIRQIASVTSNAIINRIAIGEFLANLQFYTPCKGLRHSIFPEVVHARRVVQCHHHRRGPSVRPSLDSMGQVTSPQLRRDEEAAVGRADAQTHIPTGKCHMSRGIDDHLQPTSFP